MTKLICDFCNHETQKVNTVKVPLPKSMEALGGKGRIPLVQINDEVVYTEQDICNMCAKRYRLYPSADGYRFPVYVVCL